MLQSPQSSIYASGIPGTRFQTGLLQTGYHVAGMQVTMWRFVEPGSACFEPITSIVVPGLSWECSASQGTFAASALSTVVPEDVNEPLLMTGSEIKKVFKAKLRLHMLC